MNGYHTFDVVFPVEGHKGKIKLDGVELMGVSDVSISWSANGMTSIRIDMFANVKASGVAAIDPEKEKEAHRLQNEFGLR